MLDVLCAGDTVWKVTLSRSALSCERTFTAGSSPRNCLPNIRRVVQPEQYCSRYCRIKYELPHTSHPAHRCPRPGRDSLVLTPIQPSVNADTRLRGLLPRPPWFRLQMDHHPARASRRAQPFAGPAAGQRQQPRARHLLNHRGDDFPSRLTAPGHQARNAPRTSLLNRLPVVLDSCALVFAAR